MLKAPNLSQYDKIKEYKGKNMPASKLDMATHGYEAGEWKETKVTPNGNSPTKSAKNVKEKFPKAPVHPSEPNTTGTSSPTKSSRNSTPTTIQPK